jgi:ATP-dependent DNA ligase
MEAELKRLKEDLEKIVERAYAVLDHPNMTNEQAIVLEKAMDCFEDLPGILDAISGPKRRPAVLTTFSPMLAKDYKDFSGKIAFPAYVQPKLDGVRMTAGPRGPDGKVPVKSRGDKNASPGVHADLRRTLEARLPEGIVLDGEMYAHGLAFQELVHRYKKPDAKDAMLAFYVFDLFDANEPDMGFSERNRWLSEIVGPMAQETPYIVLVPTKVVRSQAEFDAAHKEFVAQGYEGTMIRSRNGKYHMGRTADLLKRKDFDTDEFAIVGAKPGKGAHLGAVVWDLATKTGARFHATMKAPLDVRRKMYEDRAKYIGKALTVQYQGTSRDGIPRFPVGLAVRDYE